jgi:hypothetical protein
MQVGHQSGMDASRRAQALHTRPHRIVLKPDLHRKATASGQSLPTST